MKRLPPPFCNFIITCITAFCVINFSLTAQTINIDSTFTKSCEIFPFNQDDTTYGLSVSGSVVLNSDTSLVRLIFVDGDYKEYLLYEAYPYICDSWDFDITDVSDETKYLNLTQPHSVYVHVFDASIELNTLHIINGPVDFADSLQLEHKEDVETQKITAMNDNIEEHEMVWLAGKTIVSSLSYSEKKAMFGDGYNLFGLEYYSGGIYDPIPGVGENDDNSGVVKSFDWRNRHGANDPNKSEHYYNPFGTGWLTSVKNQLTDRGNDCKGLCYIYAPLGTAEGLSNLYFNQHLNFDLSEQQVLDCDDYDGNIYCSSDCDCGPVLDVINMFKEQTGIVDQLCYPIPDPFVHPHDCTVDPFPGTVTNQIRIAAGSILVANDPTPTTEEKKLALIEHGPLIVNLEDYTNIDHNMVLVGYDRLKKDDLLFTNPLGDPIIIDDDSPYLGRNYWIYKNSWGTSPFGDDGYMYHIEDQIGNPFIPIECRYYILPIQDLNNSWDILCRDSDRDGYYNWGISQNKPSTCPTCPDDRDSDDSEPRIGPYDENYYWTHVKPIMSVHNSLFFEIPNHGFLTFHQDLQQQCSFNLTVKNEGDAQLNFEKAQAVPLPYYTPITLSGPDADHFFYITDDNWGLDTSIAMYSQDNFIIEYDGESNDPVTCVVTIHLDEFDMEDFTFAIVFADCNHVPSNYTIQGQETWDGWRVIEDNYKVGDGGQLTITGHIGFTEHANLVVDRGGTLIIDGGHLINACSNNWKGIDVWGDATLSQYPTSNQGFLKVFNDGCIENANIAVQLTKENNDAPQSPYNGGIVRCYDADFINNTVDVKFYSYNNFDPSTDDPKPNRSYFFNTRFINDKICDKSRHVDMQNVDGIRFNGCLFKNSVDRNNCTAEFNKGKGIYSVNSGYYIKEHCYDQSVPCNNMELSRFENLEYGVYALNAGYNEFISIDTAVFYNTYRGVFMHSIDNPEIIRSQFIYDEDYDPASENTEPYGTDLEYCRYFTIEENDFKNSSDDPKTLGIQILNGGPYAHEVYNNYFDGLYTGVTAAGENRDANGTGLCIKCNDFTECINDIYVADAGVNGYKGIAYKQGDLAPVPPSGQPVPIYAAGNTFSDLSGDYWNYTNLEACYPIEYFYHGNIGPLIIKVIPYPIYPGPPSQHIKRTPDDEVTYNSKSEACPSNYGTGIDPASELSMLMNESALVSAYQDTLIMNVDGGDTEALNLEVQMSFPDGAMQLRQKLLDESPYLSDTVMITSIEKENVLPNAMIRDVMVANPQSAKSPSVLQTLDNRFDPIPDYMMDEIMMGKNVLGNKELYEQRLSDHQILRDRSFTKLLRYYRADTINAHASNDSIVSILLSQDYPDSKYLLSLQYLGEVDSANAFSTMSDIPVDFVLSANEYSLWELYSDFIEILWEITNDTNALDSTQVVALLEIANYSGTRPGLYALNILLNADELTYNEQVYLPDMFKVTPIWQRQANETPGSVLNVFPNPAKTYFIAEYSMDRLYQNAFLILTNISGKNIRTMDASCQQNQLVFPVDDLPAGIYILQLVEENKILESEKISIIK